MTIQARQKRQFRKTTDSNHSFPLTRTCWRGSSRRRRDKIWLADITCVPTLEGWLYLAVVLDMFSRKVVGWAMSETMPQEAADRSSMTVRCAAESRQARRFVSRARSVCRRMTEAEKGCCRDAGRPKLRPNLLQAENALAPAVEPRADQLGRRTECVHRVPLPDLVRRHLSTSRPDNIWAPTPGRARPNRGSLSLSVRRRPGRWRCRALLERRCLRRR